MSSTIDLRSLITVQANSLGVPPQIALAVAQQESGISQWNTNGSLVTGTSGEIGVFQLMPRTAQGLGVDPTDVNQNIYGGISYLAQLFQKYGNWTSALSAYNSGSPTGAPSYANSVLSIAGSISPPIPPTDLGISAPDSSGDGSGSMVGSMPLTMIAGITLGGIALTLWILD